DNQIVFTFTSLPPSTLSERFVAPIGGTQGPEWAIAAYPDHDPARKASDFRNGPFSKDAQQGTDFMVANSAQMDRAVPVYAAGAGTVFLIDDGHLARPLGPNSGDPRADAGYDRVYISHGNGWITMCDHLMRDSVTVREGDTVQAG